MIFPKTKKLEKGAVGVADINSSNPNNSNGSNNGKSRKSSRSKVTIQSGKNQKYLFPSAIVSVILLASSVLVYTNYNNKLAQNRQEDAYVNQLKQMSERVEKSAILSLLANPEAYKELNSSQQDIDSLLQTFTKGGVVKEGDTPIPAVANTNQQFKVVNQNWEEIRPQLQYVLKNQDQLLDLKNSIDSGLAVQGQLQAAADNLRLAIQADPSYNAQNDKTAVSDAANEIINLSQRINANLNTLFDINSSSKLETLFYVVKDYNNLVLLSNSFRTGNPVYGIPKLINPDSLQYLNAFQTVLNTYTPIMNKINASKSALNTSLEVARNLSTVASNLTAESEKLSTSFEQDAQALSKLLELSLLLAVLFMLVALFAGYIIYEQGQEAAKAAKEFAKNQANQAAVSNLINQIKPLEAGDLTKEVEIRDKFVGPIAKTVEAVRHSLLGLVRNIETSYESLGSVASETKNLSVTLEKSANDQSARIEDSIQKIGLITSEMDNVAQSSWLAQEEVKRSQEVSMEGAKAVQASSVKMNEIRETIQETAKKIKKLGESSQEISEVITLIRTITKQINVLALNAAINAANTGDRNFSIVAEQVQKLASDSSEASKRIDKLVSNIQEDTQGAIGAMERTTKEVVEGTKLNDFAEERLREINDLSTKLNDTMSEMANQIEDKSSDMVSLSREVKKLQEFTQNNLLIVEKVVEQVSENERSATHLEESLKKFQFE
jgi:twitching motility protein PilJ